MKYKFPVSDKEAPKHAVYPYVTHGYRVGGSYADNIKSLFQLHTEVMNAWTMILISMGSVFSTAYFSLKVLDKEAVPIFIIFTSSAVMHLPFSVGYHLFMSMDAKTFNLWRRLDVIAVCQSSILLAFSLSYFVMPFWGCMLNTLVTYGIATYASIKFWCIPKTHSIDGKSQCAFLSSVIFCYWFPMFVALIRDSVKMTFTLSSFSAVGVLGGLALSGAAYSMNWPQRLAPGRFNVWFHSHQIMHIGIAFCHLLEFLFIFDNFKRFRK